ncbi:hypothetical protein [Lentilactobacillus sp. SPB1-3]|uniref:Uncharacterized protein n=1 Tax=Lentilactobacillus terminaliae TaxID=3003483 RepID=A0ACD5DCP8_9LACO|nr:hypothetical protein [Lentilactobacillus sp. SPB1-3]MCZ0978143.1 hypothetical protein [Lentilactobacillus sp. SPB1-3]
MKIFKSIIVGAIALVSGLTIANNKPAEAKTYTTVPTSLRGHWYSYNGGYSSITANKYTFRTYSTGYGSITLHGNKFPRYARGHSQMFVDRNSKGYYNIGKYASDEWPYYKRVKHLGHTAIRILSYAGYGDYNVGYYYKTKSIAKHPKLGKAYKFRTADSTDFFYNTWRSAYLDQSSESADLYNSKDAAADGTDEPDYTLKNHTTKVYVKWPAKYVKDDVVQVKFNGKMFYMDNELHDLRPYNASKDSTGFSSNFSPNSKNIILQHGTHVYKGTYWFWFKSFSSNDSIMYIFNGKHWVKQ